MAQQVAFHEQPFGITVPSNLGALLDTGLMHSILVTCNDMRHIMAAPVTQRVQKRRDTLRAAGLRPVQIWVPDTRKPGFEDECRRQARMAAAADAADTDLEDFLDAALADLEDDERQP